jgi:hypothetical protein
MVGHLPDGCTLAWARDSSQRRYRLKHFFVYHMIQLCVVSTMMQAEYERAQVNYITIQ